MSEKKVLNLLTNDSKFLNVIYEIFEKAANESGYKNDYVVFVDSLDEHCVLQGKVTLILKREFNKLYKSIKEYKAVFIHYLTNASANVAHHATCKRFWFVWGGDVYNQPEFRNGQYESITRKYVERYQSGNTSRKILEKVYRVIRGNVVRNVMKNVEYILPVVPNEYQLIKSRINIKAQFLPMTYWADKVQLSTYRLETGDDIFVGNSSTLTNNHLDIFDVLKKLDLGQRRIVVPLSYGDAQLRGVLLDYGRTFFEDRFNPLVDLMPYNEYAEIVGKCGYVIMYHRRQQAGGNIVMALYKGAKVFLNEDSPVYSFMKELGINIFSVQKDIVGKETSTIFRKLEREQIEHNISRLDSYYSEPMVHSRLLNIYRHVE